MSSQTELNPTPPNPTQPSLLRQLVNMTWPMVFGVLSLMSFQLIDSAFIGQLGILPLAAQGFTAPMQMLIIGIQVGLGIATTAVISRALGANNPRYAKQLGGLVLVIGSVGVFLLCGLMWLLHNPILSLLSAPQDVYPIIEHYWPVWLTSSWCGALLYFYYSICRSNGNTLLPGSMMIVTSVINVVLDPILIFHFDLGINGAAYATIIAFSSGMLFVIYKVHRNNWISFDWSDLNVASSVRALTNIMGPAMTSQLLPGLSSMLATKLIASFGAATVAAWALGVRYEFFSIVVVLALTMSVPPMIGRRLGSKSYDEIEKIVSLACTFILTLQVAIAIISYFLATPLANLMTSDPAVETVLYLHLTIVPISLAALGICMLMVSVCNALAKSYTALLISGLRLFAFFLPSIWLGAQISGIYGLYAGVMVGNILAGSVAWLIYRSTLKKLKLHFPSNTKSIN